MGVICNDECVFRWCVWVRVSIGVVLDGGILRRRLGFQGGICRWSWLNEWRPGLLFEDGVVSEALAFTLLAIATQWVAFVTLYLEVSLYR